MLLSFFKTILWVIAITLVIDLIAPSGATRPHQLWGFPPRALAGGFIIGVGAAINGGCALGLLGNGQLRMLATLVGNVPRIECTGDVCQIEPRQYRSAKSNT